MKKFDEDERDILQSVESGEWVSKGSLLERKKELKKYLSGGNKKGISVRVSESDIYELKRKALENQVPYQNLIQILIHQFATDKIKIIF